MAGDIRRVSGATLLRWVLTAVAALVIPGGIAFALLSFVLRHAYAGRRPAWFSYRAGPDV